MKTGAVLIFICIKEQGRKGHVINFHYAMSTYIFRIKYIHSAQVFIRFVSGLY